MSKYMQLTVTVRPYYEKNLEQTYPKLARNLKYLYSDLVERNPSLYEIAGQLDKLLYTFDGTPLRDVLLRHRENPINLHKSIEENIADSRCGHREVYFHSRVHLYQLLSSGPQPDPEARHVPVPYLQRGHMDRPALLFNL